jgi:hypothetical protein
MKVCIGKYLWGVAYVLRVGKVEKGQTWLRASKLGFNEPFVKVYSKYQ